MNRLLAALPDAVRKSVEACASQADLPHGEIIAEVGETYRHVIFPHDAVVSTVSVLRNGGTVELATTGCEGVVSGLVALGASRAAFRHIVQVPGTATIVPSEDFRELCATHDDLHNLLLTYARAFTVQALQSVACNGVHSVEERCARWLLMTHDRVGRDQFQLTQEFLSEMLAVSRASVNLVARSFQTAGLIRYARGDLTILDRSGMEDCACECYGFIRSTFENAITDPFCR